MPPRYLVDTSALARSDRQTVRERLGPVLRAGLGAMSALNALEILYSARGHDELVERRRDLERTFAIIPPDRADFEHAQALMEELAARGKHRSVGVADLLIAECARRAGLVLLHYDGDFEHVAEITGQQTEWVVPRGSVP